MPFPDTDDLQAYRKLVSCASELDALAGRCHSPMTSTAVRAAAELVRRLASGIYRASLKDVVDAQEGP